MPLVAAKCTECGANIEIDESKEAGICRYCGTAFITQKAINNYKIDTENVFINGENVTISNIEIEAALEASNKLIKKKLYDAAKEMLNEIIEKYPYDYRGWWEMALYEYKYYGKWFNENENYQKAIVLADNSRLLKKYRNKEYERLWEKGRIIINFCENTDINMLDKIYMPTSFEHYGNGGLFSRYLGLEVIANQLCYVEYIGLENTFNYRKINHGKVFLKAEIHSCYGGARVMGILYDVNDNRLSEMFSHFVIIDIINDQVVLANEKDKVLRGNRLIDIVNKKYDKTGCYIATCVYGSYDCPQVWTLRRFRDHTLESVWYGKVFIKCYYTISPVLVKWFGHTKWFQSFWKKRLDNLTASLNQKGVKDTPYYGK